MDNAAYEKASQQIAELTRQRDGVLAQEREESERAEKAAYEAIEATAAPAFVKAYPEVTDPAKERAFLGELVSFAVERGIPADQFKQPVTSAELHILADALAFRKLQTAKAKVGSDPKPEQRKAQPAVRPGVTTSRSAVQAAGRAKDFERLASEGSVAAGAAMWKHFMK
jgi:hypothetical protein